MKRLPLGIQNFKEIIAGGYVYVDKTQHIYDLIKDAKHYFLSRPRRFGKSLLLDTIGEAFGGDKELFKGLWIYDSDHDFAKHPVVRLDMGSISNEGPQILKTALVEDLRITMEDEGFDMAGDDPLTAFKRLIRNMNQKYRQKVVVLIDEYDKPILDHLHDIEVAEANRQVLQGFYGVLKSMDPYIRFSFITGVTKFAKTSIFSGLNNLKDITLAEEYANICGIPVESLDAYFHDHIENLKTNKRFMHCDSIREKILEWYDGYSWDGETKLLNPFSLLSFFDMKKLSGFWYSSGSPKFLLDLIKKKPESYMDIRNAKISEDMLDTVETDRIAIEPLLFQTGYLTVKEIRQEFDDAIYTLEMPNNEVRRAFNMHVLASLAQSDDIRAGQARMEIATALRSGDLQKMLGTLRRFFASMPYNLHIDQEAYYHSLLYAFMSALGFDMDVEVSVSQGRVDAVLKLEDKVYVMEFKHEKCPPGASEEKKRKLFDKALGEAMDQIKDRGYDAKHRGSGKAIYLAAFAFLGRDDIELRVEC